ncbi:MAG: HAD-IA family hydrolase [Acidobacteriota bacterium]|nr:HAD-IA family hydrolase [Acidobacteriota bacterium]
MAEIGGGKFRGVGLLVFDLDGTLIDSEADLALSMNATLRRCGKDPLPRAVIASYVGQGVVALVRRALGQAAPDGMTEEAVAYFLEYYRQHMLDHTAPYPGVRESLDDLSGRKMAVLTNKPVNFSREIIAGLGLDCYFSYIYGGNSFDQKKPDPAGLFRLMLDTGATATETMMIGDSETDIQTGRNAGTWTCGVTYGIGSNTLAAAAPDLLLHDLRELPQALSGRNGSNPLDPRPSAAGGCDGRSGQPE